MLLAPPPVSPPDSSRYSYIPFGCHFRPCSGLSMLAGRRTLARAGLGRVRMARPLSRIGCCRSTAWRSSLASAMSCLHQEPGIGPASSACIAIENPDHSLTKSRSTGSIHQSSMARMLLDLSSCFVGRIAYSVDVMRTEPSLAGSGLAYSSARRRWTSAGSEAAPAIRRCLRNWASSSDTLDPLVLAPWYRWRRSPTRAI